MYNVLQVHRKTKRPSPSFENDSFKSQRATKNYIAWVNCHGCVVICCESYLPYSQGIVDQVLCEHFDKTSWRRNIKTNKKGKQADTNLRESPSPTHKHTINDMSLNHVKPAPTIQLTTHVQTAVNLPMSIPLQCLDWYTATVSQLPDCIYFMYTNIGNNKVSSC